MYGQSYYRRNSQKLTLNKIKGPLDRPGEDRSFADLDDRALDQVRIRHHRGDNVLVGRFVRKSGSGGTAR
jgi:hypothetical protein